MTKVDELNELLGDTDEQPMDVEAEAEGEYKTVGEIPDDWQLVDVDADVHSLNDQYDTDFDLFFIKSEDGEIQHLYGMYGSTPLLANNVTKVV